MLVESGMVLVMDGREEQQQRSSIRGGSFTPASCQGEKLLDRLINTGCSIEIEALNE